MSKPNYLQSPALHLWMAWNFRTEYSQFHGYDRVFRECINQVNLLERSPNFTVGFLLVGRGFRTQRSFQLWDGLPFENPGAIHRLHDPDGFAQYGARE